MKLFNLFKIAKFSTLALVASTGFSSMPAIAELAKFGPITSQTGNFPQWYEDSQGLKLELCLAPSIDRPTPPNYCLTEPPNPDKAPYVDANRPEDSNFPDEAFWWTAEALVNTTIIRDGRQRTVQATLVLATEAAFANEEVIDGDQLAFNRTRIRVSGTALKDNTKYKITYPYGVKILTATRKDSRKPPEINLTEDFGCAPGIVECDFSSLLRKDANRGRTLNLIGRPWLVWDSTSGLPADQPPLGYIGNPNVEHKVIGSLIEDPTHVSKYQNYFKVEELNSNGNVVGAPIAYTDLFSVSGKLAPITPPSTTPSTTDTAPTDATTPTDTNITAPTTTTNTAPTDATVTAPATTAPTTTTATAPTAITPTAVTTTATAPTATTPTAVTTTAPATTTTTAPANTATTPTAVTIVVPATVTTAPAPAPAGGGRNRGRGGR